MSTELWKLYKYIVSWCGRDREKEGEKERKTVVG